MACILSLATFGCGDSGESVISSAVRDNGKNGLVLYSFDSDVKVSDAGELHNEGLSALLASSVLTATYSDSTAKSNAVLGFISGYFQTHYGWDSAEVHTGYLADSMTALLNRGSTNDAKAIWDNQMSRPFIVQYVGPQETALINDARSILDINFAGMGRAQICDTMISRLEDIIAVYDTISWSEGQGDLAGGLLYLMKGSAEFWQTYTPSTTEENQTVYAYVAVDAGAYLVGWGSAVWDDYNSPGGIQQSGERRRIGQGVIWGLGTSGLAKLSKWLGIS